MFVFYHNQWLLHLEGQISNIKVRHNLLCPRGKKTLTLPLNSTRLIRHPPPPRPSPVNTDTFYEPLSVRIQPLFFIEKFIVLQRGYHHARRINGKVSNW